MSWQEISFILRTDSYGSRFTCAEIKKKQRDAKSGQYAIELSDGMHACTSFSIRKSLVEFKGTHKVAFILSLPQLVPQLVVRPETYSTLR